MRIAGRVAEDVVAPMRGDPSAQRAFHRERADRREHDLQLLFLDADLLQLLDPAAAHGFGVVRDKLSAIDARLPRSVLRCAFTGGQIRNAVLHASALALQDCTPPHTAHLEESVMREYRKTGAVCPLRRVAAPAGAR